MKKMKKLLGNERGQGMLEYVLILALVIAIGYLFKDKIKTVIADKTNQVGQDITNFDANK